MLLRIVNLTLPNRYRIHFIAVAIVMLGLNRSAYAENWTNLRGTHTVEAELIGLWQDSAVLELDNGRRVTIRLTDLRSESRIQAQELAKELVQGRSVRVKELQSQAVAAAAPAPNPLPKPPPAQTYNPPKKGAKAGDFLIQVDDAVLNGHLIAVFDALPPSYQKDVEEIVKLGAKKISPQTWQSIFGTLHQIGDLVVTKQQWFLSSPRITALPPDQLDQVETNLMSLAGLLRDTLSPEVVSLEKIQSSGLRQFLLERDQAMAPHLAQLLDQVGASARQISVESEEKGKAMVSISSGATPSKIEFTDVEGHWVPTTLAESWKEKTDEMKKEISDTADDSLWLSHGMMLEPMLAVIDPMKQAPDAAKFHAAMENVFVPIETVVTTATTLMGHSFDLAGNNRGSQGMDDNYGFDEDYELEMEEQMEMEAEMQAQGPDF